MGKVETVALDEWEVTFTMRAGSQIRRWTVQIPAVDEEHARRATHDMAWGINEASVHVWKMTSDEVKAVRVSAEERRDDPSKAGRLASEVGTGCCEHCGAMGHSRTCPSVVRAAKSGLGRGALGDAINTEIEHNVRYWFASHWKVVDDVTSLEPINPAEWPGTEYAVGAHPVTRTRTAYADGGVHIGPWLPPEPDATPSTAGS